VVNSYASANNNKGITRLFLKILFNNIFQFLDLQVLYLFMHNKQAIVVTSLLEFKTDKTLIGV
jgi:hypothetical protein